MLFWAPLSPPHIARETTCPKHDTFGIVIAVLANRVWLMHWSLHYIFVEKKNWKPSERLLPLGNPMIRCSYFCKKCSAVINVEIPHGFLGVRWMVLNVSLWTAYFYRYKERYEAIALSLSILLMKFDNFKILLNSFWTSCFSDTIEPLNL